MDRPGQAGPAKRAAGAFDQERYSLREVVEEGLTLEGKPLNLSRLLALASAENASLPIYIEKTAWATVGDQEDKYFRDVRKLWFHKVYGPDLLATTSEVDLAEKRAVRLILDFRSSLPSWAPGAPEFPYPPGEAEEVTLGNLVVFSEDLEALNIKPASDSGALKSKPDISYRLLLCRAIAAAAWAHAEQKPIDETSLSQPWSVQTSAPSSVYFASKIANWLKEAGDGDGNSESSIKNAIRAGVNLLKGTGSQEQSRGATASKTEKLEKALAVLSKELASDEEGHHALAEKIADQLKRRGDTTAISAKDIASAIRAGWQRIGNP